MYIITSYEQSGVIEITPHGAVSSARILYLSFWAEVGNTAPLTLGVVLALVWRISQSLEGQPQLQCICSLVMDFECTKQPAGNLA